MARGRTVKYPPKRGNLKRSEVKRVVEKVVLGRHGSATTSEVSKMREMRQYHDLSDREEAIAHLQIARDEYQKDGNTLALLTALQNVIEAQTGNSEFVSHVYLVRGFVYYSQKEYDLAIEDYNTVIKLKPDNADAYYNRGLAYHYKSEYDRAIEDFNKIIALKPAYANAYYNRGLTYGFKGNNDHAIADFNRAIQLNANYAQAYNNRGVAYSRKGEYDHAIEDFNTAIELDSGNPYFYLSRSVIYLLQAKCDWAIEDATKALELNPDNAEAYRHRVLAYGVKGEVDRAIEDFNKMIELDPNYANAYYNHRAAWLRPDVHEGTESDQTTARDMRGNITTSFHNEYENIPPVSLLEGITTMLTSPQL